MNPISSRWWEHTRVDRRRRMTRPSEERRNFRQSIYIRRSERTTVRVRLGAFLPFPRRFCLRGTTFCSLCMRMRLSTRVRPHLVESSTILFILPARTVTDVSRGVAGAGGTQERPTRQPRRFIRNNGHREHCTISKHQLRESAQWTYASSRVE